MRRERKRGSGERKDRRSGEECRSSIKAGCPTRSDPAIFLFDSRAWNLYHIFYWKRARAVESRIILCENNGAGAPHSAPEAHPPGAGKCTIMYFVYALYSKKLSKRYIGITENLARRLKQHVSGETPFTRRATDWILIYYEAFLSKQDAYKEEKFLKTGKGRERLKFLLNETMIFVGKGG